MRYIGWIFVIALIVLAVGYVYDLEERYDQLSEQYVQQEAEVVELIQRAQDLEKYIREQGLAGTQPGGGPKIVFEDLSGCSLILDREKLRRWLTQRGFFEELRIYVMPTSLPITKDSGTVDVIGSIRSEPYGYLITLDSTFLGQEDFSETEDHEFGHLQLWLNELAGDPAGINHIDHEEFATAYALEYDLRFIGIDVPILKATEEGQTHGPILYRSDSGVPTLYLRDVENPEDSTVIINGEQLKAKKTDPEGWHIVKEPFEVPALVTFNNHCARLE